MPKVVINFYWPSLTIITIRNRTPFWCPDRSQEGWACGALARFAALKSRIHSSDCWDTLLKWFNLVGLGHHCSRELTPSTDLRTIPIPLLIWLSPLEVWASSTGLVGTPRGDLDIKSAWPYWFAHSR
jgi:hypothetical protein